jgi:hypothetical protein
VLQRRKVSGPRIVVLEKVRVDVEVLEQDFGDGGVAARREPGRAVVSTAEVDANFQVGGAL